MSFEADAKIILTAEDRASDEVQSAADRINGAWKDYRNEQRAVERSTILSNTTLYEGAQIMKSVGHIAGQTTHLYTAYNVAQIRLAQAHANTASAQRDLNAAIVEGDPDKILEMQERKNAMAAQEAQIMQQNTLAWIAYGTEAAGIIGSIIKEYPKIKAFAQQLGLINGAGGLTSGGIGGIGGGVGLGGIGGKLKGFAGSNLGKATIAPAVGLAVYEGLTETDEGKFINQNLNPFTSLFNGIFALTHSSEQTAQAEQQRQANLGGNYGISSLFNGTFGQSPTIQQTNNFYGTNPQAAANYIASQAEDSSVYD